MLYICSCSVGLIELVSWFITNNNDLKYNVEGFINAKEFVKYSGNEVINLLMHLSPYQYYINNNNKLIILTKEQAIDRESRYNTKMLLVSCLNMNINPVFSNEDLIRCVTEYV